MKKFLFAVNRDTNTAQDMNDFRYYECLQIAFRSGIKLSNGSMATGIGRCKNEAEFKKRAQHGKTIILENV